MINNINLLQDQIDLFNKLKDQSTNEGNIKPTGRKGSIRKYFQGCIVLKPLISNRYKTVHDAKRDFLDCRNFIDTNDQSIVSIRQLVYYTDKVVILLDGGKKFIHIEINTANIKSKFKIDRGVGKKKNKDLIPTNKQRSIDSGTNEYLKDFDLKNVPKSYILKIAYLEYLGRSSSTKDNVSSDSKGREYLQSKLSSKDLKILDYHASFIAANLKNYILNIEMVKSRGDKVLSNVADSFNIDLNDRITSSRQDKSVSFNSGKGVYVEMTRYSKLYKD